MADLLRMDVKGLADVQRALGRVKAVISEKNLLDTFGPAIAAQIVKRTDQGRDVEDRAFAPLKSGRASRLRVTGQLHQAVAYSKSKRQIFVKSTRRGRARISNAELAVVHQRGKGVPVRRFLGLSRQDVVALDTLTLAEVNKQGAAAARPGLKVRGKFAVRRGRIWKRDVA